MAADLTVPVKFWVIGKWRITIATWALKVLKYVPSAWLAKRIVEWAIDGFRIEYSLGDVDLKNGTATTHVIEPTIQWEES